MSKFGVRPRMREETPLQKIIEISKAVIKAVKRIVTINLKYSCSPQALQFHNLKQVPQLYIYEDTRSFIHVLEEASKSKKMWWCGGRSHGCMEPRRTKITFQRHRAVGYYCGYTPLAKLPCDRSSSTNTHRQIYTHHTHTQQAAASNNNNKNCGPARFLFFFIYLNSFSQHSLFLFHLLLLLSPDVK